MPPGAPPSSVTGSDGTQQNDGTQLHAVSQVVAVPGAPPAPAPPGPPGPPAPPLPPLPAWSSPPEPITVAPATKRGMLLPPPPPAVPPFPPPPPHPALPAA